MNIPYKALPKTMATELKLCLNGVNHGPQERHGSKFLEIRGLGEAKSRPCSRFSWYHAVSKH